MNYNKLIIILIQKESSSVIQYTFRYKIENESKTIHKYIHRFI